MCADSHYKEHCELHVALKNSRDNTVLFKGQVAMEELTPMLKPCGNTLLENNGGELRLKSSDVAINLYQDYLFETVRAIQTLVDTDYDDYGREKCTYETLYEKKREIMYGKHKRSACLPMLKV